MKQNCRKNLTFPPVGILAGGKGSRLGEVLPKQQKVMAQVRNRPFLDFLLHVLVDIGFKDLTILAGHLSEQITSYYEKNFTNFGVKIQIEDFPLGTGGACKVFAKKHPEQDVLIMNGDTVNEIDYISFIDFHHSMRSECSLALKKVIKTSRFGAVELSNQNKIVKFNEKSKKNDALINRGIYLIAAELLANHPQDVFSLEHDFFPKMVYRQEMFGKIFSGNFLDFGVPSDFKKLSSFLDN